MKFKVLVKDTKINKESENVIEVRKNTSMKSVVLKAVEKHVDSLSEYSDPTEFMREVKSLHKEAFDLEDFTGWLQQDLDLTTHVIDLNNRRYYNKKHDTYTTSYDEGLKSFESAWKDQLGEEDGEQDFDKYKPDFDTIIEHGNGLCDEEYFLEDWELEEE